MTEEPELRLGDIGIYEKAIEVADYADTETLFRDFHLWAHTHAEGLDSAEFVGQTMLAIDGDSHAAARRLHSHLFRREALVFYEREVIQPAIERAMAAVRASRGDDGVAHVDLLWLNRQILSDMAARLVGVGDLREPERRERFVELSDLLIRGIGIDTSTSPDRPELLARCRAAKKEIWVEFLQPEVENRLAQMQEGKRSASAEEAFDLLTLLVSDDPNVPEDLIVKNCALYIAGSQQTVVLSVVHVIDLLAEWFREHPDRAEERFDLPFLRRASSETIRLRPPIRAVLRRSSIERTVPSTGETIHEGDEVALHLFAANREENVFGADPHAFDPDREPKGDVLLHGLSFGAGKHVCIGRRLALPSSASPDEANQGVMLKMLRAFYAAGIGPDPERPPGMAPNVRAEYEYDTYPVIFTNP